jgi:WD40 repeat protein
MQVISIDASADGRFIATASHDNTVKIWDAKTTELISSREVKDAPNQIRFSPNSKRLACVDRSNFVTIWDSGSGEQVNLIGPFAEDLTSIGFFDQSKRIVIGTSNVDLDAISRKEKKLADVEPVLRVVDLSDESIVAELSGHSNRINSVDCTLNGEFIVSGGEDSEVRVWKQVSRERYELHKRFNAHSAKITSVAISPTQSVFATCGGDAMIKLWELETGNLIRMLVGHEDVVNGIRFSSDGRLLVSASSDRTAKVWVVEEGTELVNCQGHFDELNEVCFSADNAEIFSASDDQTARVWNARRKSSTVVLKAHENVIWQADFSPDGQRIVSASEDGTVRISNVETGQLIGERIENEAPVLCVAHSPTVDQFVTGDVHSMLRVFDSKNGRQIHSVKAHEEYIWDVCYSQDGKRLLAGSSEGTFSIWNTDDWSLVKTVDAHEGELGSARFSNDGKYIVTASDDRMVKLWDAESLELIRAFSGHGNSVWRAIFSPNDKMIASSSYDGEIIIWNLDGGRIQTISAHQNQIAGLTFSNDGKRVVSASDDQSLKIWNIESGIELFVLRDKDDSAIVHTSFSPDGTKLVSGNQEGWLTIRSAIPRESGVEPLLPKDAEELVIDGIVAVTESNATDQAIRRELEIAERCIDFYPSFQSYTIQGIAHYRSGNFSESLTSLLKAQRLEPLEYGEPDLFPNIEAYLAMTLLNLNRRVEAENVRAVFERKIDSKTWNSEEQVRQLKEEVANEFSKSE